MPNPQKKIDTPQGKLKPKSKLEPVKNPVHKLSVGSFKVAEYARQFLRVIPSEHHTINDTLKPEYWAHVSTKLQITDRVEAIWADNTKFAEYIVVDVGPQWAKVVITNEVDLSKASKSKEPEKPNEYEVKYGNHITKYVVVRLSDNMKISQDHANKEAAEQWLAEHKKSM